MLMGSHKDESGECTLLTLCSTDQVFSMNVCHTMMKCENL